jgi:hypothetical protein
MVMDRARLFLFFLGFVFCTAEAHADSIAIGADRYENVYITEGSNAVYVCLPGEGRTISVLKGDPALGAIAIEPDKAKREAIYQEFTATRDRLANSRAVGTSSDRPDYSLNGQIESVASRESADSATPRPGVPEDGVPLLVLRGEPRPPNAELQAIIERNLSRAAGGRAAPAGAGFEGGTGAGGRVSGGSANAGGPAGGAGPRAGGTGGRAGGGQGGAGGRGGSPGFSNISDLFGTKNDAEVGETPNPITSSR